MKKNLERILSYTVPTLLGCMEWTRCLNTDGYPRAVFDGYSNGKVHRVVWELANEKDATGKVVRHTCDNTKCINPAHLEIGTPIDNVRDRDVRQRNGWAKLSHEDVKKIRRLYATKEFTQKELGMLYHVTESTVNSLIKRRHWKHVA